MAWPVRPSIRVAGSSESSRRSRRPRRPDDQSSARAVNVKSLTPYHGTDYRLCDEQGTFNCIHAELQTSMSSFFAGVLAAIGASVCCVGPLVLLMLGHRRRLDRQSDGAGAIAALVHCRRRCCFWAWLSGVSTSSRRSACRALRVRESEGPASVSGWIFWGRRPGAPHVVVGALAGAAFSFEVPHAQVTGLPLRPHHRCALALLAAATPQTAVLDVQNMTCSLCPVTVKKALEKVARREPGADRLLRRRQPR